MLPNLCIFLLVLINVCTVFSQWYFGRAQSIIFPPMYNRNLPPSDNTTVWVSHAIRDIADVNDRKFSVSLILETMMGWNDNRIKFNQSIFQDSLSDKWYFMNNEEYWRLWKPILQVERLKQRVFLKDKDRDMYKNDIYAISRGREYSLFFSYLSQTTISCAMDFSLFPFDEHFCRYEVTSGTPDSNVELKYFKMDNNETSWGWANVSSVLRYKVDFCDIEEDQKRRQKEFFVGFKPVVSYGGFKIKLTRISTPYVLNYYLPSGLFVLVSWTSYAIPVKAIPGRVALIMTTFLSLVNIANSAFESSPSNQGINLMQIWIISCMGMVFMTVLEYFVLIMFDRFGENYLKKKTMTRLRKKLECADKILLKISPVFFLTFCFFYTIAVLQK